MPPPTTFDSSSWSLRRSGVSTKAFLPVPRMTGKTIRLIWSTRSLWISSWTSWWLPGTCSSPSNSALSLLTCVVASPPSRTVVLFHSGSLSVVETTNFGIELNLSANSPSRWGQAPAKLSYVRRPRSRASACLVSSSLNWLPSSPRSNSKVQPGYLKSGSPPGASITPSSDTNSVTTILAGMGRPPRWVGSRSRKALQPRGVVNLSPHKTGVDPRTHRRIAGAGRPQAQSASPRAHRGALVPSAPLARALRSAHERERRRRQHEHDRYDPERGRQRRRVRQRPDGKGRKQHRERGHRHRPSARRPRLPRRK